jgi:O-antigen/teichoic acid export membrane protein
MRVQSKSVLFSVANILKLLTVFSLTLFFIIRKGMGIPGIYLAQVTGNLLYIIFLSGFTAKNCIPSINLTVLRSMTSFGFPLMLANFAGACFAAIDRYSLNSMALMKYVALYSLAFKISSVLRLVIVDSIKMAVSPMIIRKIDDPDNMRFYSKLNLYSSYVLMMGVIAISLFSYEAIKVMSRSTEFWEAFVAVPLLSISVFFVNMRETTGIGLTIKKKTWIIGIIVVVSSVINVLLNILLIPEFDMIGAASATIITNIFYWLACYYFSQKAFFIPYDLSKIMLILITGSILSFSGLLLSDMQLLTRLVLKTMVLISFPFILYFLKFYEPAEMQSIKGFIRKWSNLMKLGENLRSIKNIGDII